MNRVKRGMTLLIAIALIAQAVIVYSGTIQPLLRDIRSVAQASRWERSARLGFGDRFAGYMSFLVGVVPEGGRIVVPPTEVDPTIGNIGIMQYFLLPRSIVNCPEARIVSDCLETFAGPETYFLYVRGFPDEKAVGSNRELREFSEGMGVYMPVKP